MVRLKDVGTKPRKVAKLVFQFQYGAIKGINIELYLSQRSEFQFQYGAIKGHF